MALEQHGEEMPGYLTERSLVQGRLAGEMLASTRVKDICQPSVVAVPEEASPFEIAAVMVQRAVHRVLVMKGEKLIGLVSALDVVNAIYRTTAK